MWHIKQVLSKSLLGLIGVCTLHEGAYAVTLVNNSDVDVTIYLEAKNGASQSDIILRQGASYRFESDQTYAIAISPLLSQSRVSPNNTTCWNNYTLIKQQFISAGGQQGDTLIIKGMARNLSCELSGQPKKGQLTQIPIIPAAWY